MRADFSIFLSSDNRPLTEYVNEKCYIRRDHEARERAIIYIYDFSLISGTIITFIYIIEYNGFFDATKFLISALCFVVLRYVLMGVVMFREIAGKKRLLKALDLMANGIFLSNKKNDDGTKELGDVYIERNGDFGEIVDKNAPVENISVEKTH
jgi:hypothetical protein